MKEVKITRFGKVNDFADKTRIARGENHQGAKADGKGLRKSGLVDMITDNYTKAEIQSWPEEVEEEEEIEEAEEMIPEKAEEEERIKEPEPAGLGTEEPEKEPGITSEEVAVEREGISTQAIIGIIIGVAEFYCGLWIDYLSI